MTTAPTAADSIDTMARVSTQPSSPEVSEIKYNTNPMPSSCVVRVVSVFWVAHHM